MDRWCKTELVVVFLVAAECDVLVAWIISSGGKGLIDE
jgi:hypothetical protein